MTESHPRTRGWTKKNVGRDILLKGGWVSGACSTSTHTVTNKSGQRVSRESVGGDKKTGNGSPRDKTLWAEIH